MTVKVAVLVPGTESVGGEHVDYCERKKKMVLVCNVGRYIRIMSNS